MPDISMCATKDCPKAWHCKRRLAKPSLAQSYSLFQYKVTEYGIKCDGYIHVSNTLEPDK